jgi:EAL domain-containing protein (putative c-di-GMP-specific phosphodiesterase class I)
MELAWLDDLLMRDALVVQFQPIVRAAPAGIHGYECIVSGVSHDGSLVAPAQLFAAAQKLGRLPALDGRMRLAALRQIATLPASQRELRYFFNLRPDSIYNPAGCLRPTFDAITAAGVSPEQVVFELGDANSAADRRHLGHCARVLRERGCKVALDDVGAAFLCSSSATEFAPDYIKIDPGLVRRSVFSGFDAKIVRDLAEAARRRGIDVIAQGIENEAELRFVRNAGVPFSQGAFHARPAAQPLNATQHSALLNQLRTRATQAA